MKKPSLNAKPNKDKMVSMRITEYHYNQLRRLKTEQGLSPSDIMEYAIDLIVYNELKGKLNIK